MKRWTPTRARALIRHHGPRSLIFRRRVAMVGGAISIGLIALLFAWLSNEANRAFLQFYARHRYWPLVLTPIGFAALVWITRRTAPDARGSGIPQVIAATADPDGATRSLISVRTAVIKALVTFGSLLVGGSTGREGPTVQLAAAMMAVWHKALSVELRASMIIAGGAGGVAAAFNTPLAGVVFAIEELSRSFVARSSGTLITAIIFSGVVALGLQGNYLYFGQIKALSEFHWTLIPVLVAASLLTGVAGGLFGWLMLNVPRWMPAPLVGMRRAHPVRFAFLCGLAIAIIGLVSGGTTFGSGYAEARGLLESHVALSPLYALLKFAALCVSYLSGIPGGIFAPSLAIGAGLGNVMAHLTSVVPLPAIAALCMVGYLAAVTQSPITSFVIVMEMIDGHQMVIPLMAVALLSTQVSKTIAPSFYHALAHRFLTPTAPTPRQA